VLFGKKSRKRLIRVSLLVDVEKRNNSSFKSYKGEMKKSERKTTNGNILIVGGKFASENSGIFLSAKDRLLKTKKK